jgi:tRNA acetyltransferase TAN1
MQYKIELRIRNHSTLTKQVIFDEVTKYIPETWIVKLDHPEIFILVEVFKV